MVTISVALCTYNGARFIAQQLLSILGQTLQPTEVVVSDDGSTDATLEIVRSTWHSHGGDPRVLKVLDGGGRRGVTANFQRAVEACTGDLIALCDQDDVWRPDRLASAVAAFGQRPGLLLQHSDARLVDDAGEPIGVSLFEAIGVTAGERAAIAEGRPFDAFIRRNLATGATVMFRRSLLDLSLPFPAEWVHDEWLAIIAAATGEVQLLDAELIDYRQHGSNQIGARKPTLRYRIGRMLAPRGQRYRTLARRAAVLASRLEHLPVDPAVLGAARERARFDEVRARLPKWRMARVPAVLREYRRGSYAMLSSQGRLDVARDLLQPA